MKRPITSAFESSQPLLLYGANGRVCAIPTYRVYRLYDTWPGVILQELHGLGIKLIVKVMKNLIYIYIYGFQWG